VIHKRDIQLSNWKYDFVEVPINEVIQINSFKELDELYLNDQLDCFVKVSILVKQSEAHKFDAQKIRDKLYDLGAKSVILEPKFVKDVEQDKTRKAFKVSKTSFQSVKDYVDELPIENMDKILVQNLITNFMSQEGI